MGALRQPSPSMQPRDPAPEEISLPAPSPERSVRCHRASSYATVSQLVTQQRIKAVRSGGRVWGSQLAGIAPERAVRSQHSQSCETSSSTLLTSRTQRSRTQSKISQLSFLSGPQLHNPQLTCYLHLTVVGGGCFLTALSPQGAGI